MKIFTTQPIGPSRRVTLRVGAGLLAAAALPLSRRAAAQSAGSAGSADWARIVAAAKAEGRVVLYTNSDQYLNARLKSDFEKVWPGIVLEVSRLVGRAILTKVEQERQSGAEGADVVISADMAWIGDWIRQGLYRPLAGPNLASWPKSALMSNRVAILDFEPLVLAYNTKLVKTPITRVEDVMKPEFTGKIVTQEAVGVSSLAWYDWAEKTMGKDFLDRLAVLKPRVETSAALTTQAVASGEQAVVLFTTPSVIEGLIANGAPVKMVIPPHAPALRHGGAVLGSAKRPNAALVLLDYLMSVRGQTAWNGKGGSASPLPGIVGALPMGTMEAYRDYTGDELTAYRIKWDKAIRGR